MKNHYILHAASERQVELSSSIDRDTLARSLGFESSGVKLIYTGCKDPASKVHVNLPTTDSCLVQRKEMCFPYEIVLAKDNSNA